MRCRPRTTQKSRRLVFSPGYRTVSLSPLSLFPLATAAWIAFVETAKVLVPDQSFPLCLILSVVLCLYRLERILN